MMEDRLIHLTTEELIDLKARLESGGVEPTGFHLTLINASLKERKMYNGSAVTEIERGIDSLNPAQS